MITYQITETGYRIFLDGVLWIIQEGEYANVYPGDSMEERAKAHVNSLNGIKTPEEEIEDLRKQVVELESELKTQSAINDILTGGNGE